MDVEGAGGGAGAGNARTEPTRCAAAEERRGEGALRTAARAVGFCLLGGVLLATASVLPFGGLGLVALAPLLAQSGSAPGGPGGAQGRPLAALIASPVLLGLPLFMASDPVVSGGFRCGTGLVGLIFVYPVLAFFTGVVASAGAIGAVAVAPRVLARAAPVLRTAALLAGGVLIVAAAVKIGRATSPEDWVSSLPVAARTEAPGALPAASCHEGTSPCPGAALALAVAGEGRSLSIRCATSPCQVQLGDAEGATLPIAGEPLEVSAGGPLEVRFHDRTGVVVLLQGTRTVGAIDLATGQRAEVSLREVASEVAPSFFALLAMAAGLLVAAARTRRGFGERGAVTRLLAGVSASVDDAGVVHPDDDTPPFRPPGPVLAEGAAVILARPAPDAFRSGADRGTWVLSGPRAAHVATHRARSARFDLEAAAAVALGAGPLAAAALQGLVL